MDALVVARYELIRRVRNRSALFTAFVGPLALAVVFSLLVGGAGGGSWTIGVVDLDRSEASTGIVTGLLEPGPGAEGGNTVRFAALAGRSEAVAAVDDGDVDAAVVIPAGYGDRLAAGAPEALEVLRDPDRPVAGQVARSVAASIGEHAHLVALAAAVTLQQRPDLDPQAVVAAARAAPPALVSVDVPMGEGEVSVGAYYGASMAVLFLFFTIGLAARSLVAERRSGTLSRILATPARLPAVIAGKTLAVAVLGFTGFATTWAVTSLAFGADWGSPPAVLALMVATVVSIGGVSMFVAALARTDQQAETYTAATAFLLALLGGNFIQPGAAPAALERLSRLTPNGWALDAFTAVSVDGGTLVDVASTLGVLLAIGAAFGLVATVLLLRRSAP